MEDILSAKLASVKGMETDTLRMKMLVAIAEEKEKATDASLKELVETHYLIATELCPVQLGQALQVVQGGKRLIAVVAGVVYIPTAPYYRVLLRFKEGSSYTDPVYFDDLSELVGIQNCHVTTPDFQLRVMEMYRDGVIVTRPPWWGKDYPLCKVDLRQYGSWHDVRGKYFKEKKKTSLPQNPAKSELRKEYEAESHLAFVNNVLSDKVPNPEYRLPSDLSLRRKEIDEINIACFNQYQRREKDRKRKAAKQTMAVGKAFRVR